MDCLFLKDGRCTNSRISFRGHKIDNSKSSKFFCQECIKEGRNKENTYSRILLEDNDIIEDAKDRKREIEYEQTVLD